MCDAGLTWLANLLTNQAAAIRYVVTSQEDSVSKKNKENEINLQIISKHLSIEYKTE